MEAVTPCLPLRQQTNSLQVVEYTQTNRER